MVGKFAGRSRKNFHPLRISGDGRFLLLLGKATDLGAQTTGPPRRDFGCSRYGTGCLIYHYDRLTEEARLVVADARFDLPKFTFHDMSEDGRTVVFTENGDLIEGQTRPAFADIFLWDADTGNTVHR